jgi:TolB protein
MKAAFEKKTRIGRVAALLLALAAAVSMSLAGAIDTAEAKKKAKKVEKIVFASDRTSGRGVNNPEGDFEIFLMNPDGTKRKQLTENAADAFNPTLSPNGKKIAFTSQNVQSSNPEGDSEIYLMNTDGSAPQNLTDTAGGISDSNPNFSPDGEKIVFTSNGVQFSNPEGDFEVYLMNAPDGSEQQNLSNTAGNMSDFASDFSPDGEKIAYSSFGVQPSNPEGDFEVYSMNTDGSDPQNLTNTAGGISDFDSTFSPDGKKVAYVSSGAQSSNPEGDDEIYKMNASDGSKQQNLTNNANGIQDDFPDYAPDGKNIVYDSDGNQSSNPEGDDEIYKMNVNGSNKRNLTDTRGGVNDSTPDFGEAKKG